MDDDSIEKEFGQNKVALFETEIDDQKINRLNNYKDENEKDTSTENKLQNNVQNTYESILEILRYLWVFMFFVGLYTFLAYFPITFDKKKMWGQFLEDCCLYEKCNLTEYCKNTLEKLLNILNISLTILNDCCYWFAPYNNNHYSPHLYCNSTCIR
jgi:hypothetical protein